MTPFIPVFFQKYRQFCPSSKGNFQKLSAKNIWNFPYVNLKFLKIGLLRGKNKNVIELPKNHFKDVKKSCRFSIC